MKKNSHDRRDFIKMASMGIGGLSLPLTAAAEGFIHFKHQPERAAIPGL